MTTRCLMAFDYADWHAHNVLQKQSQKRPLGDIESKHRYRPAQPVLSCRTVDVDLTGTRTYRARSTTDIITEQHRYIHNLYNKARNIVSAPPRRKSSRYSTDENCHKLQKINIEVNGRPVSSLSQSTKPQSAKRKTVKSAKRPKTTGQIKSTRDLLETSRSQREITEQIHQHWLPENNNLNQGQFIRGQKKAESVPTSLDAWLTFGGAPGGSDKGVVDAFASYRGEDEYYNIDGNIGSRVAQQLQRGDKLRIGINGVVQSNDLKVRKKSALAREEVVETVQEEKEEEIKEKEKMEEQKDTEKDVKDEEEFDFMADLNMDIMTQDIEDLIEETEEKPLPIIPLSWTDQINKDGVRILSPRSPPLKRERTNLCETRPVVFEKLIPEDSPSGRPWVPRTDGYQVKYRQRPQIHGLDTKESRLSRIKVISIDPRSKEEDEKLNNISVDEILQTAVEKKTSDDNRKVSGEKDRSKRIEGKRSDDGNVSVPKHPHSASRSESRASQSSEHVRKRVSVQSHAPSTTVKDLSIVSPGVKHKAGDTRTGKSAGKAMVAKGLMRSPLGGSGPSIKSGNTQGETEYIQIASQLRVPGGSQRPTMAYTHQPGPQQDRITSPERPYLNGQTSPRADNNRMVEELSSVAEEGGAAPSLASPEPKSPVPALEISIPTADDLSDRESILPSPNRPGSYHEDGDDLTSRQRREASMRDEQIDQIASMLGGALIQ
ncbi:LOW QUALITY PROTEIN: uncharacterized protein LOC124265888 [Haliotis rubra]|uniref:LOW QUALITY PROTEIN: uncharacterized protein LOC124265888 n=1 Tax=Haliotis rubra TaxID=36100 RepID=UPI001EE53013|nr:LOW QUALITY PROTEIN: uncharacterized protein LOC124265888 [Haliotis rubra]